MRRLLSHAVFFSKKGPCGNGNALIDLYGVCEFNSHGRACRVGIVGCSKHEKGNFFDELVLCVDDVLKRSGTFIVLVASALTAWKIGR